MFELRRGPGLADEPLAECRVGAGFRPQPPWKAIAPESGRSLREASRTSISGAFAPAGQTTTSGETSISSGGTIRIGRRISPFAWSAKR